MEEEEVNEAPMQTVAIPANSEGSSSSRRRSSRDLNPKNTVSSLLLIPAYLNVNTNATTRGDAQVSGNPYRLIGGGR